MPELEAHD
jgi:hypothetical protein